MLGRDECWEQASRLLMLARARLGNRAKVPPTSSWFAWTIPLPLQLWHHC
jgi:hypothetical protein